MSVPSEITGNPTNSNPEQKSVIPFQDGDMVCQTELFKAADMESNVKAGCHGPNVQTYFLFPLFPISPLPLVLIWTIPL